MHLKEMQKLWSQCRRGNRSACDKYHKALSRANVRKQLYKEAYKPMSVYKTRKVHKYHWHGLKSSDRVR